MKVKITRLVEDARERYEDALTCEAIRRFLAKVTDVPRHAWGEFDWSRRWASDWATAAEARLKEAASARDVQDQTGGALFRVAASYGHADVTAAYNIDVASDNGLLRAYMPKSGEVTARPGGGVPPPGYPDNGYQGHLPPEDPDNPSDIGSRLRYMELDHRWNTPIMTGADSPPTEMERAWAALGNTPGRAALLKFVNDHYTVVSKAENFLRVYGLAPSDPPTGMFDEALKAVPGIIENRSELLAVAKNGYAEMANDIATDTKSLLSAWSDSEGADAYETHATNCAKYYRTLAGEANWFHTEGKKAAKTVDNLMLAYANVGYEKIRGIIDKLDAAQDAADSFTDSLDDPLKALAKVVNGLADIMLQHWRAANNQAQAALEINKAAINGPQLGTVGHSAQPFPGDGGVENNTWKASTHW